MPVSRELQVVRVKSLHRRDVPLFHAVIRISLLFIAQRGNYFMHFPGTSTYKVAIRGVPGGVAQELTDKAPNI